MKCPYCNFEKENKLGLCPNCCRFPNVTQLSVNFFPEEKIEKFIDNSLTIDKRDIYIRRDEKSTFIHIGGLNFLDKPSGVLFNFYSDNINNDNPNYVYYPEIHNLSYNEIIIFIKNILFNHKQKKYVWNYDKRCYTFKLKTNKLCQQ